jgi:hypothetical protein
MNRALKALIEARASLPHVHADSTNEQCGNSPYISLPALMSLVTPSLEAKGLFLNFRGHGHDGVEAVVTHLESGDQYGSGPVIPWQAHGNVHDTGTANTYGKRYAVFALLALCLDTDTDGNRTPAKPAAKAAVPKPTPKPPLKSQKVADSTTPLELASRLREAAKSNPITEKNLDRWRETMRVADGLINMHKWEDVGLDDVMNGLQTSLGFVDMAKESFDA